MRFVFIRSFFLLVEHDYSLRLFVKSMIFIFMTTLETSNFISYVSTNLREHSASLLFLSRYQKALTLKHSSGIVLSSF